MFVFTKPNKARYFKVDRYPTGRSIVNTTSTRDLQKPFTTT